MSHSTCIYIGFYVHVHHNGFFQINHQNFKQTEFLCLESACEGGLETEPRLRHKVWRRLALKIPQEFIHSFEVVSNQHSTQCFFRNPWPGTSICWSLKENIGCFDGL